MSSVGCVAKTARSEAAGNALIWSGVSTVRISPWNVPEPEVGHGLTADDRVAPR